MIILSGVVAEKCPETVADSEQPRPTTSQSGLQSKETPGGSAAAKALIFQPFGGLRCTESRGAQRNSLAIPGVVLASSEADFRRAFGSRMFPPSLCLRFVRGTSHTTPVRRPVTKTAKVSMKCASPRVEARQLRTTQGKPAFQRGQPKIGSLTRSSLRLPAPCFTGYMGSVTRMPECSCTIPA